MFHKSVDASNKIMTTQMLCDMIEKVVHGMGEQYVIQIATDNAANYIIASRLFMSRYPSILWTSCVAHYIDLMLKDIGKINWIQDVVEKKNL